MELTTINNALPRMIAYPPALHRLIVCPWYFLVAGCFPAFSKHRRGNGRPLLHEVVPNMHFQHPIGGKRLDSPPILHPTLSIVPPASYSRGSYSYTQLFDAYKTSSNSFSNSAKSVAMKSAGGCPIARFNPILSPCFADCGSFAFHRRAFDLAIFQLVSIRSPHFLDVTANTSRRNPWEGQLPNSPRQRGLD